MLHQGYKLEDDIFTLKKVFCHVSTMISRYIYLAILLIVCLFWVKSNLILNLHPYNNIEVVFYGKIQLGFMAHGCLGLDFITVYT